MTTRWHLGIKVIPDGKKKPWWMNHWLTHSCADLALPFELGGRAMSRTSSAVSGPPVRRSSGGDPVSVGHHRPGDPITGAPGVMGAAEVTPGVPAPHATLDVATDLHRGDGVPVEEPVATTAQPAADRVAVMAVIDDGAHLRPTKIALVHGIQCEASAAPAAGGQTGRMDGSACNT